jgi:hypothetical protein
VRVVVDLHRTDDGAVAGTLTTGEMDEPQAFSGWLDLLRLLEMVEVSNRDPPRA